MNQLIYGHDAEIAAWVAVHLPTVGPDGFGPCTAIGVSRNERLVAGVVYNGYVPDHRVIHVSIYAANSGWASRRVIKALLGYPFIQLGVNRVTAMVEGRNTRAQKFLSGIGFVREGVARYGFGAQHAHIYGMLRREYDRMFKDTSERRTVPVARLEAAHVVGVP